MNKLARHSAALIAAAALALPVISSAEEQGEVRNGGITTMLKNRDYELVLKPTVVTVFVYQDEKPAATQGATGTITITQGDKKTTLPLTPTGANALEAKGTFAKGGKASATITLAGRKPQDVTWALK
ncbi:hypothetical protein [Piscinibacter terrae]|uniref:Uncharacterized protein n=1 Tax=Piscinibacter terrae TaxID=2496871 RepID=A0A3N7ISM5_9BURK|nr:hypothetical protein [Albitalea terrae]RQP21852.1 hypothetical protein DZC73_25780 [Albitalea terrae]